VVVVAKQIGTKRHGAIARREEDYFVFEDVHAVVIPGLRQVAHPGMTEWTVRLHAVALKFH
jgi:hypothetical protein